MTSAPRLAAFPKAFMDPLCIDGSMRLEEWITLAADLEIEGLEFYAGFLDLADASRWSHYRKLMDAAGMDMPMLCCSPDFCHGDADFRASEVEKEEHWIRMTAELGGSYCRVLSGQRRPEISVSDGVDYVVDAISACLPIARAHGITLILENHYKDNYWTYPEFAQRMDVFCAIVDRIDDPHFGVNYDPSNTLLAGEDPIELLKRVQHRVVTMHASDRFLKYGTIEDLRKEEDVTGYAARLSHGEIGKGMIDYDATFGILSGAGFNGWISIEDGVEGMDQLKRSVAFLRAKIAAHWPSTE